MAVTTEGVRIRKSVADPQLAKKESSNGNARPSSEHPAGPVKHGLLKQALRIILFGVYFFGSCIFIHGAQLIGAPLYFINKSYFYSWMAVTKQYFGLLITTMTQWWSPTIVRISGDASVAGQLRQTSDGRVEVDFPHRLILIANHQIYTDWLYLWWTAYTARFHGFIYIILKQSLKWVPLIGPAMQLYSFIFMARKWASDQQRIRYRLDKLNKANHTATGEASLDPMWLLIFPEGTNLSKNTRRGSKAWSEKAGVADVRHCILPRSTGLQLCLQETSKTIEYLYDCTIAYEHIPPGQFGQDIFTLRSVYFQGRAPKSVNMHWRRFRINDIPYDDREAMEKWTLERWREKDELLEQHLRTGRFPSDPSAVVSEILGADKTQQYLETEVRPKSRWEILQIFSPVFALYFLATVLIKLVNLLETGRLSSA